MCLDSLSNQISFNNNTNNNYIIIRLPHRMQGALCGVRHNLVNVGLLRQPSLVWQRLHILKHLRNNSMY